MSDPQRREFLAAAAAIASMATLAGTQTAVAGDPSFMNNVPDSAVSGKELPTFKFALEKSDGKVIGNSYGKEATVTQLPISKGMAGVSMQLEPGAMREMHWHATAAEWAFVFEGRVRTTVIDPNGSPRPTTSIPATSGIFPAATATCCSAREQTLPFHSDLRQRLFFRVGTFSITDWIGHTPKALLAKNFGVPNWRSTVSLRERCILPAASPPHREPRAAPGLETAAANAPYRLLAQPPHRIFKGGREWRSIQPASDRQNHYRLVLDLDRGALRALHWHPNSDEWQYVLDGTVSVTMFGSHGRIRNEPLHRATSAISRKATGTRSRSRREARRILIGFNSGTYETIDLSQWIAANPADVLATNFSQPAELFGEVSASRRVRHGQGWARQIGRRSEELTPAGVLLQARH